MGKLNTSKIALIAGHILFWLFNYWLIAFATSLNWNGFTHDSGSFQYAYLYGLFFNALVFYIQIFWLFPKMYNQGKKRMFYVVSIFVILLISITEAYFDYLLLIFYGVNDIPVDANFNTNTIFHILYSIAGFYYILKFEYKKSKKISQALVEENYKTELKYLKAQLNPHFLFNGINSVYHLIGKNDTLAKETLLQFSGLLRYQLYESETYISLEKELNYVLQYIKIEETRKGSDIQLDYEIEFESSTKKIAPLLLIPFIENTFKHCSSHAEKSEISIRIIETGGTLTLNSTNSFDNLNTENPIGGIGLNNVKRRLSLLYPNEYHLEIEKGNTDFIVDLSINL
ncbi:sensor histidine kinase [Aureibaculum luteum]|uniref:sensor histidine kinase n=1 Tax=Aureibaculum luteum TaxID=1548456 RepID=UPI000E47E496|nr:histidine kinase [Aureibaculum luteum]